MKMFEKKKKANTAGNYFRGYGKTVPVQSDMEDGRSSDTARQQWNQTTDPYKADDGGIGLISIDTPGPKSGTEKTDWGNTEPVSVITSETGKTVRPVVGWIVCVKGPNKGNAFALHADNNYIGSKARDIVISGDSELSPEDLRIVFDSHRCTFLLAVENARKMIYLNGNPVSVPEELHNYDTIEAGSSEFKFLGFCGEQFNWDPEDMN